MKKLKSGLSQAVGSTIIGLIVTAVIGFMAVNGWIPSYSPLLLSIFNLLANVFTLTRIRRWGLFYTLGWLGGALIFNALGLYGTADYLLSIVAPVVILFLRMFLWIKKPVRKMYGR